ncbi:MAG: polyphosphate kinase 2 [Tepidisphaeraceae bacterium]|jgi:polyphosphate kinase 2
MSDPFATPIHDSSPSDSDVSGDSLAQAGLEVLQGALAPSAPQPQAAPEESGLHLSGEETAKLASRREFIRALRSKNIKVRRIKEAIQYENELELLQIELVKLQRWIGQEGKRLAIIFEGRDAAGKGGTIRRFIEHLNPRAMRVVALPKPTEEERGQWYFQRYMKQLPNKGEIVFFDRSWYNRGIVEPVNGFCSRQEYERFMQQVPEFEHMLVEDGVILVKFWFSISRQQQLARFKSRENNPLKQWKLSPLDGKAQELWDAYSRHKELVFSRTHTSYSPWIIVKANNKKLARLESIRYLLALIDYDGKDKTGVSLLPDPNIVTRFHRNAVKID